MTRMTARSLNMVVVVLTLSVFVSAQNKKPNDARSAREIRAVLDRQVEAWNRQDLESFMSGYWNSPNLTFYSGGAKTAGWKETLDRYRNTYQSEGREMGRLEFSDIQIEMLGPQSALVRGRWRLKTQAGEPNGLFTLIFRRLSGAWKIVHDHTGSST